MMTCERCLWFKRSYYKGNAVNWGECRKNAPAAGKTKDAGYWPCVNHNDFCGEFKELGNENQR